jgi:endonuclease G
MPRRSNSLRNLSLPSLIVLGVIVGFRFWQESREAPQKPQKRPSQTTRTNSRTNPRSTSRPRSESPSTSSGRDSNEGNLLLGNPTDAGRQADNYLLERDQYSMSYNRSRGGSNWVAWHTDSSNFGDTERGKFAPDPDLPADWQIRPTAYKGTGYDKGHVCPSGDRTSSRGDNNATFYMSNMLPQTPELNQHVWADFENYLRDQVRQGNEIYEIAGGAGDAGKIDDGRVTIPQICWKVAIILPEGKGDLKRINGQSRVIAVGMPNVNDDRLKTGDWRAYLTTAAKIQSATKLDLLSSLPGNVQKLLEAKTDSGD